MEIRSDNICIRKATIDDARILCTWWNDTEIMAYAGFPNGWNISEEEIVKMLSKETDKDAGRLIIEIDDKPCGEMVYNNKENNVVELGLKMCDPAIITKGYGAKALKMFMNHVLDTIG
jgi:RimJ/RimL family protein N-acetyltransferase